MIDLVNETLVSFSEVPKLLPKRANGKRLHISAIYRWAQKGVRGIMLESIRIGGTTYTSKEALQRFADSQTANENPVINQKLLTSSKTRKSQADRAAEQVLKVIDSNSRKSEK